MPRKVALDTNLFIDAFRDIGEEGRLATFHARFAPLEYLSAIVAFELRAGARPATVDQLARHVFGPFERSRR